MAVHQGWLKTADGVEQLSFRAVIPMTSEGDISGELHICPRGVWKGHPDNPGKAYRFDDGAFNEMVTNFEKQANPMPIDKTHEMEEAYGWIHELEIRQDGLWASKVEWLDDTAKAIKAGQWRFCSPVIDWKAKDRKENKSIGVELINVALTNNPFLDGQRPIELERFSMAEETKPQENEEETVTENQEVDASAAVNVLAEVTGLDEAAVLAALIDKAEDVGKVLMETAEEEGTPAEEEEEAERKTKQEKPEGETEEKFTRMERQQKDARITALEREVKTLSEEKTGRETAAIEALVDEKIETGFVRDADRADAIALFTQDRERAERIFCHQVVPIGQRQAAKPRGKNGKTEYESLTDGEKLKVDMLHKHGKLFSQDEAIAKVVAQRS